MTLTILGLALWWGAHFFKRIAPEVRASMGNAAKAAVAVAVLASVVLMTIGYRGWDGAVFWGRSGALTGINNLLMLAAFYIYATGAPGPGKPRAYLGRRLRHPQLIGFSLWAAAHLVVNGDVPSFVLFGGLLVWALTEIAVINRSQPEWTPPPAGGTRKEIVALVAALVIFTVAAGIHAWLGYNPFG